MIHKIFTLLAVLIMTASVFAQAPEKFSYQAVIRDASNELISNQEIGMQISILQGSITGTAVYVETQMPTSNSNGLISLEIGMGTIVSGDFATIDWANGPYFIKTETDPTGGTDYTISGTSQLLSVPYALHAKTADNSLNAFSGDYNDLTNQPEIPTVPSDVSAFNNDAGYLTSYAEMDPIFTAWDKDYNDLINTPTNVSEFVNDANYITSEADSSVTNEIQNLSEVLSEGNDANNNNIVNIGQVGIGTASPSASAALEVNSTTGAFILPRMTTIQRDALTLQEGMMIYNLDTKSFQGCFQAESSSILHNNDAAISSSTSVGTDGAGTPNYVGQSFVPNSSGLLQNIAVNVNRASTDQVTVSVYSGVGYGGSFLGEVNTTLNSTGRFEIDLSSLSIDLQSGQNYSFRLYSAAGFATCPIIFHMVNDINTNATYPDGTYLDYQGNANSDADLWFEIYYGNNLGWTDLN